MKLKPIKSILLFIALCYSFAVTAQFEVGGFMGLAQYQGDLAEQHIELGETLVASGLFLRFHVHPNISLRTSYYNGKVSGDDANSTSQNIARGWKFSTKIHELSFKGEWNILSVNRYGKYGQKFKAHFTPIIFGGLGVTFTNPTLLIPKGFDLSTLKTSVPEPDNTDTFLAIPYGIALRYDFSKFAVLGLELGSRVIFSDYLDNVSLNGNEDKQDLYIFGGLNLSVYFD